MEFHRFNEELDRALNAPLPGQEAQAELAPLGRGQTDLKKLDQNGVKKAAVLALFMPLDGKTHLILTERTRYPGVHSGQISFPGGAREPEDHDFKHTALREAHEEVGIDPARVAVKGTVTPLYIPPSNFLVYPYIGTVEFTPQLTREEKEVEQIHSLPWNAFLHPEARKKVPVESRGFHLKAPAFVVSDLVVWGATAMIISEITALFRK